MMVLSPVPSKRVIVSTAMSRPRQLRSDQGASDAVQDYVLGASLHFLRDVVESESVQPVGKAAGRPCNVSRSLGGTLEAYVDGHDFYLPTLGHSKPAQFPARRSSKWAKVLAGAKKPTNPVLWACAEPRKKKSAKTMFLQAAHRPAI